MHPKPQSIARGITTLIFALGLILSPAAAVDAAEPTTLDPSCAEYFGVGAAFLTVSDTSVAVAGLPQQVTLEDMSCVLNISDQQIYVYLTDAFTKFVDTIDSLEADGWQLTRTLDDGTEAPFDRSVLASAESADGVTIVGQLGKNLVAVFFSTDAQTSQFLAPGTFIIATPLVNAPSSGTTVDDPSAVSNLRTIAQAAPTPAQSGVLVVAASLLTLLLGLPAYLLSTVLTKRYEQWFGWLERGRVGRFRERLATLDSAQNRRRWAFLLGGMVIASLIASFVDPRFGFNGMSARLFITFLVSFALFNIGAWAVVNLVLRRLDSAARSTLTLHPAALIAVAIAVLASRLLNFDPGIVFGLVAGVTFAVTLVLSREALVVITGSAYAGAVALIAWIVYSALSASGTPTGAIPVGVSEFFASITLEGVSTLPIALIPLATLDGAILFRWKRWAWALSYAIGVALFMLVLLTVPGGQQPVTGDFLRWVVIFVVFGVVAVGVWLADWLIRRANSTPEPVG